MTDEIQFQTFDNLGSADAGMAGVIVQCGERGELDIAHATKAAAAMRQIRETYPAAKILLLVSGFDNDPRELWEIPEVVDYMVAMFDIVFADWPEGTLLDLNLDQNSLSMALVFLGTLRPVARDPVTGVHRFEVVRTGTP